MRRGPGFKRQTERGGAMVEFALLNLVLIPLVLYSVFLMDAVYMKLELQENVVSGIWDFSVRNVERLEVESNREKNHATNQSEGQWPVQGVLQMVYSDHTSAYDDGVVPGSDNYNDPQAINSSGDDHKKHHVGFGAQFAYEFEGGRDTQFKCETNDEDMSWSLDPSYKAWGTSKYAVSGLVTCEATAWIYNYIIPEEFMPEFSEVKLSSMTRRADGSSPHEFQGEGGNIANIKATERAAISYGTWALRNGSHNDNGDINKADIGERPPLFGGLFGGGPQQTPYEDRVNYTYTMNGAVTLASFGYITARALQLANTARSNRVLVIPEIPGITPPGLPKISGTFLTARYKPNQAGIRQKPPGFMAGLFHQGFLSTPYTGPNNTYRDVYNRRGAYYLGCRTQQRVACF